MKKVIIFYGYGETPESFWYPYTRKALEDKGYNVLIPELPNTNNPMLDEQLEFSLKNLSLDQETIVVGHSSGCPLILALLEKIDITIDKAILVAGYTQPLKVGAKDTKNIKEKFDWETIRKHCREFIFINAENDPWGANDKQGKIMHEKLGGNLIINREGHMGSDSYNQPYKEFPFLVKLITE